MTRNDLRHLTYRLIRGDGGYGSQRALAAACGVAESTVSKWRNLRGDTPISLTVELQRLLRLQEKMDNG